MPWKIEPKGDKFEVVEEAGGKHPGKVFGIHDTKPQAEAQLKALYANVPESNRFMPVEMERGDSAPVLYRNTTVEPDDFSDENTFQIAISSEWPGQQRAKAHHEALGIAKEGELFTEVLSHEPGDVDLSWLNSGRAAFLDEHKSNRHLGKIRKANLGQDKVVRGVVEFDGETKLSKTRRNQMRKKSRVNISCGYVHTRYLGPVKLADGTTAHRFAMQPREASSVADPLDPTVGLERTAQECACYGCGKTMNRTNMKAGNDGALYCSQDCIDAEDADESLRTAQEKNFRAKSKAGDETTISHSDLRNKVVMALDNDKRFKSKSDNGDVHSSFQVHDIHQIVGDDDDDDWQAIVSSPAWSGKYHAVDFTFDGKDVTLGDSTEVQPKTTFEAVERGLTQDGRLIRSSSEDSKHPYGTGIKYADPGYQKDGKARYPIDTKEHAKAAWSYINQKSNADKYSAEDLAKVKSKIKAACKKFGVEISDEERSAVDLQKLTRTAGTPPNNLPKTIMAKNVAELEAEAPALVTEIRSAEKTATRAAVLSEMNQAAEKRTGRIGEHLKEIRALADAHCADSGKNWAGPDNAVVVVADEIRKLERAAYDEITGLKDDDAFNSNAVSIRNKFKTDAGELVRNSYAPRDYRDAGTVEQKLANETSLKRLWDKANEAFSRGDRRPSFFLSDGAEAEADKELRNKAGKFPGGLGYSPEGQLFPLNSRGHIAPELRRTLRQVDERRANGERLTRDSLLSDFPSLGALVPPEYMTPIELLRNKLVLVGNGLMEVHGVVGNPLTFPRLSAPTTAQSLAEGVALNTYDQVFDQVKLTPHRVGTAQKYSRLGMSQAPGFEAVVWDDHARVAALYMNRGMINGAGGGDDVLGILNYVGINPVAFAGSAANAWKNIFGPAGLVTLIRKANIDDDITLLSTSVGAGTLRTTAAAVVGATAYGVGPLAAILQGDEIGGQNFEESQQIPADILLAVAARHIILATWAGLNVVLDTVQFADQDKFRLVTNQYYDVGLRHSQAVSRSVDNITALA